MNDIDKLKKQHFDSYKSAVLENIKNNSNVLLDEDIMSLIKKPPLDSMDVIKNKFLSVARKNKIVIDNKILDKYLDGYRKDVISIFDKIKLDRIKFLSQDVNKTKFADNGDIIKLAKKDFNTYNKKMKKEFKDNITKYLDKNIIKNLDSLFSDEGINYEKIKKEVIRFLKNNYLKQLLENIDIKVLVKDATLMNNVREQGERYLFTLSNSRLFD